jgi:methyl-accepting chemotaxis protein
MSLQIISAELLKELDILSLPLKGSPIYASLQNLKNSYYGSYVTYRKVIYPLTLEGGPYAISQKEFLDSGVNFLNQIAVFMNTVVIENQEYTSQKLEVSRKEIIKQSLFLTGALLLISIIFFIVNSRIINPIIGLTENILLLGNRKTDVSIPYLTSANEIGEIARAVDVFKKTLLSLDKNLFDLETVSNDRSQLIVELEKTLEEVKNLRKIIPICSYCKNIRNDQGYYEEIESYFSKHSGADFSHTICPECLNKHYPDIFKKMEKDS